MTNMNNTPGAGIDLGSILSALFQGNSFAQWISALGANNENSLIIRRHTLRAERELLLGLMAVIDDELEKVEADLASSETDKPVGREQVKVS